MFVSHYRQKQLRDLVVVAPDVGSAKMARGFAKRLNASLAIIDKRRPSANVAEVLNVVGEVADRDVLIPDDMIDTAGTMAEAVTALKRLGARDIYCCATHALLSGPAVDRLVASPVKEVTVTNTIDAKGFVGPGPNLTSDGILEVFLVDGGYAFAAESPGTPTRRLTTEQVQRCRGAS